MQLVMKKDTQNVRNKYIRKAVCIDFYLYKS